MAGLEGDRASAVADEVEEVEEAAVALQPPKILDVFTQLPPPRLKESDSAVGRFFTTRRVPVPTTGGAFRTAQELEHVVMPSRPLAFADRAYNGALKPVVPKLAVIGAIVAGAALYNATPDLAGDPNLSLSSDLDQSAKNLEPKHPAVRAFADDGFQRYRVCYPECNFSFTYGVGARITCVATPVGSFDSEGDVPMGRNFISDQNWASPHLLNLNAH